jgi:hypothetical protein
MSSGPGLIRLIEYSIAKYDFAYFILTHLPSLDWSGPHLALNPLDCDGQSRARDLDVRTSRAGVSFRRQSLEAKQSD